MSNYGSELSKSIEKFVLLAPCYLVDGLNPFPEPGYLKNKLAALDIYWYGGGTWEADLKKICAHETKEFCEWAQQGLWFGQAFSTKDLDTEL